MYGIHQTIRLGTLGRGGCGRGNFRFMAEMTAADCVRALTGPVGDLGARWMLHPETLQAGTDAGYANGFAWYTAGRGGVLGDVDADVVVSSFAYFEPTLVRKMWDAGTAVEGARAAGRRYAKACADWGQKRLAGVAGMDRLATLADKVIDEASVEGLTLFAGWRAEERPADAGAHAYFNIHLLRELRGCVHIIATTAQGLSALESILADAVGGPARAKNFGWSEPYPDTTTFAARREAAEADTDRMLVRFYEVLTPSERSELVGLIATAKVALDANK